MFLYVKSHLCIERYTFYVLVHVYFVLYSHVYASLSRPLTAQTIDHNYVDLNGARSETNEKKPYHLSVSMRIFKNCCTLMA